MSFNRNYHDWCWFFFVYYGGFLSVIGQVYIIVGKNIKAGLSARGDTRHFYPLKMVIGTS